MSIDFKEYISCLDEDHPHIGALEASYSEAGRILSPQGLNNYLEGVKGMCVLGRGPDLILSYIQEMPLVAKEVGEDVIPDIIEALMKMASHTSGTVLVQVIQSLPLAARRFGEADMIRHYLKLLHQMTGRAPRGIRPMMENMEELLSKLTLGGLRRWVMWGMQAHARDLDGQMAYFALQTEPSKSMLQKERRGTLFVDNQRKLNFYLRALWGRAFFMRPTAGDYETRLGLRPFIEDYFVHMPDAFDDFHGISGMECYRAVAAHAAAHLVYTKEPIEAREITPAQMKCIDIFEDARVEYLAMQDFPGLKKLWQPFFTKFAENLDPAEPLHPSMAYMMKAAHLLIDESKTTQDSGLLSVVTEFRAALEKNPNDNQTSWNAGMDFYHLMYKATGLPSLNVLENFPIPYRDDNRYVWSFSELVFNAEGAEYMPASREQVRRDVGLMEFINEVPNELAGDDAEEIWTLKTELFPYEDMGISINDVLGREPVSEPFHYPEWDYHIQLHRPDWATVIERRQGIADPELMDDILVKHRPIASRIRHLVDAMQPEGIVRKRGYEEGEEIDLNAAVNAMIDIRRGVSPDPKINIRITRHIRDLAVVILLDLSESTNERINKEDEEDESTILSLTREATGLMSWAIDSIGDPFAVHGFASDGRHDVQYYRFKDFGESYNDDVKSRMAGMKGGLSTRMGAALRHAGHHLIEQPVQKRLVLLVTDGEPADIDERDPQYLRHDTKKAVEDLAMQGVFTYCLTLDPMADQYVARIFGDNRYSIIDNVERLPERLPAVFAALTG